MECALRNVGQRTLPMSQQAVHALCGEVLLSIVLALLVQGHYLEVRVYLSLRQEQSICSILASLHERIATVRRVQHI